MNKQIQQQKIDEAVNVFKKILEATYLSKSAIKDKIEFHGFGTHSIMNFFSGSVNLSMKKNGNMRISGEIPKICFREGFQALPRKITDWRIFPLVFTMFHYEEKEEQ